MSDHERDSQDWGAQPLIPQLDAPDEEPDIQIGAESIFFRMPKGDTDPLSSEPPEMIDVNLLQVINQLFVDMGHFDRRLRALEGTGVIEDSRIIKV